jgi:phosphate acetyltransferase
VAHRIYICSAEGNTGKSTVALGALDTLSRRATRVGVFRPISRSTEERDYVLDLLLAHDSVVPIEYDEAIGVSYDEVHADPTWRSPRSCSASRRSRSAATPSSSSAPTSPTWAVPPSSATTPASRRISAPPCCSCSAAESARAAGLRAARACEPRTADELAQLTELAIEELAREHATLLGIVVNRADPARLAGIVDQVAAAARWEVDASTGVDTLAAASVAVWAIPEDPYLVAPSMRSIMEAVDGELYAGDPDLLDREALGVVVAAMSMENVLPRLIEGSVVVIPATAARCCSACSPRTRRRRSRRSRAWC